MSTNHTENIGLSQWLATDEFKREDFNADNAIIDSLLAASMKCATGSYTGTGAYGSSNKNTLTFESQPKLVIIQESDDLCCTALFLWNSAEAPMITTESSSTYAYRLNVSYSGTTLSWYNESAAWIQLNHTGRTYSYFALL